MSDTAYDLLESEMSAHGAEAMLERLAERLRDEKRFGELFETRLIQARHRLGLPATSSDGLENLPEAVRSRAEEAYLEACREVGKLLLGEGQFREAWPYLRLAGETGPMAEALAAIEATDENLPEILQIALDEGVAPELGLQLVLDHYGTCNAITAFEGTLLAQPPAAQSRAAALLVRHLYGELLTNVRAHIESEKHGVPAKATLAELVAEHAWIFEKGNYHIDMSHLAATVRFARLIEDPEPLRLAVELTEYGRRLSEPLQAAGEPPFEDHFASHGLFFSATLGQRVEEAQTLFGRQAEAARLDEDGSAAVETYLILLHRMGRFEEALEVFARLVPPGMQLSAYAPKMFALAQAAAAEARYLEICRERGDLLGFAAGLIERCE